MLAQLQRQKNLSTLLVGKQINKVIIGNSVPPLPKIKIQLSSDSMVLLGAHMWRKPNQYAREETEAPRPWIHHSGQLNWETITCPLMNG